MTLLEKARSLSQLYARKQAIPSAIFWAEKALCLSGGDINDLAAYASLLHGSGQHRRAAHALLSSPLLPQSAALRYLAAKCYVSLQEWEQALALLKPPADDFQEGIDGFTDTQKCSLLGDVRSATLLLQAHAHEGLGSMLDAVTCYKEALMNDVFCAEALEELSAHHSLSAEDEKTLLSSLPFRRQCCVEEEEMLRTLYKSKLRYHRKNDILVQCSKPNLKPFATNADILWSVAHSHLCNMNIEACYNVTKKQLEKDPFHPPFLLLLVACCVELSKHEELFTLGQRLVSNFSSSALSWYAVSSYYFTIKNQQNTRRYLSKTLSLDAHFAPAHVAFGHSFAIEGEHDQAISAYSKAARIMKGSPLPLMQLGREYELTGSSTTAVRFMKSALALAPTDPALLQEIGVILTRTGNLEKAVKYFTQALTQLQSTDPHTTLKGWEPVYNNLGHVYRRQRKFSLALKMHHEALALSPTEASTLTSIAYVYLLRCEWGLAVEYCLRSLKTRREDQFTLETLRLACEEGVSVPLHLETETLDLLEPENEILEWDRGGGGGEERMLEEAMYTN